MNNNKNMTPVVSSFEIIKDIDKVDYFLVSDKEGEKKRLPKEVFISHISKKLEDNIKSIESRLEELLDSIDVVKEIEKLSIFDKGLINIKNSSNVEKDDIKEGSLYYTRSESGRPILRIKTKDKWITI